MGALSIRDGQYSDIEWMSDRLRSLASLLDTKNDFCPPADQLTRILAHYMDAHVALVAEIDGKPVGFIIGTYFDHPWCGKPTLSEVSWWVDQEHRSSGPGRELLNAFIGIGKRTAAIVSVAVRWDVSKSGLDQYMEHSGLRLAEKTYMLEV